MACLCFPCCVFVWLVAVVNACGLRVVVGIRICFWFVASFFVCMFVVYYSVSL